MTNKKKQRAKKLSKKSGMSHAAAMNKLNDALAVKDSMSPKGHGLHNLRHRPTRPEDVADMDQELIEFFGPTQLEIKDIPPQEVAVENRALYDRVSDSLGLYRGINIDPEYSINKSPLAPLGAKKPPAQEVRWVPREQDFKRPSPKPSPNMRPSFPRVGYKGYNWVYIKNVEETDYSLFQEYAPWWEVDDPNTKLDDTDWNRQCFTEAPSLSAVEVATLIHASEATTSKDEMLVPIVFTNRRLNREGKTPFLIRTIRREDVPKFRERFENPPKWLSDLAKPRAPRSPPLLPS